MKKKQELMTRVVTAAIYVGIMIIFILPGLWVPMKIGRASCRERV